MRCAAKNWDNFLRLDDGDKEVQVSVKESDEGAKPSKEDLLGMLDEMIKNIENLPRDAMLSPINHYDLNSVLLLFSAIVRQNS